MTTKEDNTAPTSADDVSEKMAESLRKMEALSERLSAISERPRKVPHALQGPGQDLYMKSAAALMQTFAANPAPMLEHQAEYWGKTLEHWVAAQEAISGGELKAPEDHSLPDRRFADEMWTAHPWFNFLKQQYIINAEAVAQSVKDIEGLEPTDKARLEYFTRQIVDMMSPTNFLGTNPEALQLAVETEGESLVKGMENLVRDLESGGGHLKVALADEDAFTVGENIATTEGSVVYRNRLFELIQYAPKTDTVKSMPLLIFPPWINKYYILDLKPANSLISWIVEQGYTLFVVSWVDPDESYRDVRLDDYIEEGYLTAIEEVRAICDVPKINVVGYCIAGTTLSLTMALLKKRGLDPINSATLFTTMTDFSDQGEFSVFLQDDFVDGIEEEVNRSGILDSFYMARTFSFLRSNDLIYGPAVRAYMMGKPPPAFDLLYWNSDGTNLPAKMAVQYLRHLCQEDRFATTGIEICGETLHLSDVTVPIMAIACETDHIAAWKASYNGVRQMGSTSKTFILSESGHIAGIVNPPSKKKYGHYVNTKMPLDPDDWLDSATEHAGSWWPRWSGWLGRRSGKKIPARVPGADGRKILAPAPGTYVHGKRP